MIKKKLESELRNWKEFMVLEKDLLTKKGIIEQNRRIQAMRLIKDTVKLSNKIITSKSLSHNAVLAYTGLRMLMLRDSYVRSGLSYDICTSSGAIAYELGIQEPDKYILDAIRQGLMELAENQMIKSTPCVNDYIIDTYNLCLDIKEPYVKVDTASINLLMDSDEQGRKIPLLRYYIVLTSVGGYSAEVRKKLTHKYVGSLAQITCEMTCHRYNQLLESIGIIQKEDDRKITMVNFLINC